VARALLLEPVVVFADEPTNDLDAERAGQLGELLYQLPSQGRALVLVTHDRGLVGRADHTVNLSGVRA
jgi:predicted ABC-type transport system involved in lysophospholipase L1 biosynthesis ATPase subunit